MENDTHSESTLSLLDALVKQALILASFDGWNEDMAQQARLKAGICEADYIRQCPNGFIDILRHWVEQADDAMATFVDKKNIASLKIRDRIRELVLFRLDYISHDKEAFRRAYYALLVPWQLSTNLQMLHTTVDKMWRLAGDASNDYNWYSKRLLLCGVYSATISYWLNDESANYIDTKSFLDRRIENVMRVGGAIGKTLKKMA